MLKLIIKMPSELDAKLLLTTAIALADYKSKNYYKFGGTKYDVPDYSAFDLQLFEPDVVFDSPASKENHLAGVTEYELGGDVLDVFLMETLYKLQAVIPFEMYFEQRGKYDAPDWLYEQSEWAGEIDNTALHSLFGQGYSA